MSSCGSASYNAIVLLTLCLISSSLFCTPSYRPAFLYVSFNSAHLQYCLILGHVMSKISCQFMNPLCFIMLIPATIIAIRIYLANALYDCTAWCPSSWLRCCFCDILLLWNYNNFCIIYVFNQSYHLITYPVCSLRILIIELIGLARGILLSVLQ